MKTPHENCCFHAAEHDAAQAALREELQRNADHAGRMGQRNLELVTERDALRAEAATLQAELLRTATRLDAADKLLRSVSTMDCFFEGAKCAPDCSCLSARASAHLAQSPAIPATQGAPSLATASVGQGTAEADFPPRPGGGKESGVAEGAGTVQSARDALSSVKPPMPAPNAADGDVWAAIRDLRQTWALERRRGERVNERLAREVDNRQALETAVERLEEQVKALTRWAETPRPDPFRAAPQPPEAPKAHGPTRCPGLGCPTCRYWAADSVLRAPGCKCHGEEGDSACPVHGTEEEMPSRFAGEPPFDQAPKPEAPKPAHPLSREAIGPERMIPEAPKGEAEGRHDFVKGPITFVCYRCGKGKGHHAVPGDGGRG